MVSSSPISIPASEPNNNIRCDNDGGMHYSPPSISSQDEDGRCGASALSAALRNTDPLGDLVVGSLPMHLRRPVKSGISNSGLGDFAGPVSLPQLRAPFLSSTKGPKDILSSMPEVTLPANAVSANPTFFSSIQYGSLRESRFPRDQCDYVLAQSSNYHDSTCMKSSLSFSNYTYNASKETEVKPNGTHRRNSTRPPPVQVMVEKSGENSHDVFHHTEGVRCNSNGLKPCTTHENSERAVDVIADINEQYPDTSHEVTLNNGLTAFEVLTQIKALKTTSRKAWNERPVRSEVSSIGNHVPGTNSIGEGKTAGSHSPLLEGESFSIDADDHHVNPDTFEAFEFELEG
eukprot:CAMPEP_0183713520 /NCGR_PEP_ID=MMETSP0737-20130205/8336_1 /TAXON_ID=385413 /ORGANISM="Thalassiosira miniscula, Strain CCMP1093" /LENGTH=345 /DNA_ID=CAMNT_0025942311 /DNA_START=81 /DNA_END=1118 /DNA_ORIENTATION=+